MADTAAQNAGTIRNRGQGKRRAGTSSPPVPGFVRGAARTLSAVAPALAAIWLERLFLTPRRYRMPDREKVWTVGAEVWHIPFDADRLMSLYAWGQGPVVLLAHGFSGRGSQMGAYIAPLVARGYRVVTFDAPAHGASGGRQTALPEAAEAICTVAANLGPLAGVIAHSNGAAATSVALSQGMDCARVAYVSPPEDLDRFLNGVARFLGFTGAVAARTRARVETRYGVGFDALRGAPLAARQSIPALIAHDRADPMVPFADGQRIAEAWPGAELIETEGLGHARILRDPGVVAAVVAFVAPDA